MVLERLRSALQWERHWPLANSLFLQFFFRTNDQFSPRSPLTGMGIFINFNYWQLLILMNYWQLQIPIELIMKDYRMTLNTNLVTRVYLLCLPKSLEQRSWLRLVTWPSIHPKQQGGGHSSTFGWEENPVAPPFQQIFVPPRFWVVTWPAATKVSVSTTKGSREERTWERGCLNTSLPEMT